MNTIHRAVSAHSLPCYSHRKRLVKSDSDIRALGELLNIVNLTELQPFNAPMIINDFQ